MSSMFAWPKRQVRIWIFVVNKIKKRIEIWNFAWEIIIDIGNDVIASDKSINYIIDIGNDVINRLVWCNNSKLLLNFVLI